MNLFDLFARLTLDSSEYSEGLEGAEKETSSFGSKLKSGLGTAAKVTGTALTAVTGAAAAVTGAMVNGASNLASYGDEIDKASQKLGLSADAYQEWDAVLQHSGSSISALTGVMRTLTNESETNSEAFEKLGISQEDLAEMSREDMFATVITGLQNMDDESERAALAQDLLGRNAAELGALLNTSAKDTLAMRKRVHELGGVLSKEAVGASAAFQDNLQDMKTAMSGVSNNILSELLPGLTELMGGFTGLIIGEQGADEALSSGFSNLMASVSTGLADFMTKAATVIPSLVSSIVENIPLLIPAVVEIITQIGTSLIENLPLLLDSALAIIQALGDGLSENLPVMIPQIIDILLQIVDKLTDPESIGMLIDTALTIIMALADGLVDAIPKIIEKVPEIIDNLLTAIMDNLPKFIQAGIDLLIALVEDLPTIISEVVEAIPTIIDSIIDALVDMIPMLVQAGVQLFVALIQNLPTIIVEIVKALPQIIKAIVGGIVKAVPELAKAGLELIKGLWKGIGDAASWLWDKISGFFGGILSKIKGFFGIKSPSRVFAGIGEMLDKGLAKGIDDYADVAVGATDDLAEDVMDSMGGINGDLDFTATGNGRSGVARGGVIINVYGAVGQDVEELADIVSQKISFAYRQEQAVWA